MGNLTTSPRRCPHCGQSLDTRGVKWRVRVRLYVKGDATPVADSDTDRPPAEPGATVIRTLPAVAEHVSQLAHSFHISATLIYGLDMPTLRHRLKSLRPTLSRRGGDGTWRIPYSVDARDFVARVDVERAQ